MTKISRISIESSRVTILRRRNVSTVKCQHCGKEFDLINSIAVDVFVFDKRERVVRVDESPLPPTFGAWRHALFSRLLRSIGKTRPD